AQAALMRRQEPARAWWQSWAKWQILALLALIGWLYAPTVTRMMQQWWRDPNFSHGFFVPLFSLWVLYQRREKLAALQRSPSTWGLLIVLFSLGIFVLGVFGAELFLSRISLILLIAGLVLFFAGWAVLRAIAFPVLLLFLMIPIPAIVFNQITFPLQILASK